MRKSIYFFCFINQLDAIIIILIVFNNCKILWKFLRFNENFLNSIILKIYYFFLNISNVKIKTILYIKIKKKWVYY